MEPAKEPRSPSSSSSSRHCHKPKAGALLNHTARKQLIAVVGLCLLFMTGEAVGGYLANSLALFTDVLHLGSDLISFLISLLAIYLAKKPATKRMSFGYHRTEVLGALFSVFLIWLVSGVLCYVAIERILEERYKDVKPDEMLITASIGVVCNLVMAFVLHSETCCGHAHSQGKFGHNHSHGGDPGHSHGDDSRESITGDFPYQQLEESPKQHNENGSYGSLGKPATKRTSDTMEAGREDRSVEMWQKKTEVDRAEERSWSDDSSEDSSAMKHRNINVRAALIHVIGDIIQSVGVLIAALIIKFTTAEKYRLADPICTFLFSVLVLVTTITVLRDALLVMMEGVPRDLSIEGLRKDLRSLSGVVSVHSLHVWALTMDRNALAVHLAVEQGTSHRSTLTAATVLVQDHYHFFHTTVQVEDYCPDIMEDCAECSLP